MRGIDVPIYTTAGSAITFKANVGIGSPPTYYTLIVDTGSANTWVSAHRPFVQTETSRETNTHLSIRYGTGGFRGKLWYDLVTLGDLVIENQGIGVAENAFGFEDDVDGILGLGLTELTTDSLVKGEDGNDKESPEIIPTILDNLFAQGKIQQKTLAISFDLMSTALKSPNYSGKFTGVLTFGGTDPSRFVGDITYVPIPQDKSSSKHWSFEQRIIYDSPPSSSGHEILSNGIGVIDTGSSVIHLTPSSFEAYRQATKSDFEFYTGLLSLPQGRREQLKSLFFEIGGRTFEIPPEEQIWPQELNDVAGGPSGATYLVYVEMFDDNGVDISLINGFTWLQQFYVVLDAEKRKIGFAKAASRFYALRTRTGLGNKWILNRAIRAKSHLIETPVGRLLSKSIFWFLSLFPPFPRFPHPAELRLHLSNLCTSYKRRIAV